MAGATGRWYLLGMNTFLQRVLSTTDSVLPLIARLVLGIVILPHGLQKLLGWFGGHGFSATMSGFTEHMHIPWIFALAAVLTEALGSLALIAGFASRVSAALVACVMAVAALTVHLSNGFFMNWAGAQKGEGFEYHLLAIGLALVVVIGGGGRASVDRLLVRKQATAA
jgi:putative oxidoreductase